MTPSGQRLNEDDFDVNKTRCRYNMCYNNSTYTIWSTYVIFISDYLD